MQLWPATIARPEAYALGRGRGRIARHASTLYV